MAYLSGVDGVDGLGCGSGCSCRSCSSKSGLSEYYYEGEGRDPPRGASAQVDGFGEVTPGGLVTREVRITIKSYIAPIGMRAGVPYCGILNLSKHAELRALAATTDAAYSEDPLSDARDKHYRLYTSRSFSFTCSGGNLVKVVPSPVDADVGLECIPRTSLCLTPPPLIVYDVTGGVAGPTAFSFSWGAKGRPHRGAETAFQVICPRTSFYIWHHIQGRIECGGDEPKVTFKLTGSGFPSHRVWVNGALRSPTIPQGPFTNLWIPASMSDPTLVR